MNKKESISSSFFLNALFLIFLTAGLTGYFWIISGEYKNFNEEIQNVRNEYIQGQKNAVKNEVTKIIDIIDYKKETAREDLRDFLKEIVTNAFNTAENIYNENKASKPEHEIRKMIKDALRKISFSKRVIYIFIDDSKSVSHLYPPDEAMEGKAPESFSSMDAKSAFYARMEDIRKAGEGFMEYQWKRPGDKHDKSYLKLSFVKYFQPYDWFIGAGEYPENIDSKIQKGIISKISSSGFANGIKISIENLHGSVIWSTEKEMIGKDVSDIRDNRGIKVYGEKKRIAETPSGGFIQYVGRKPGPNEIAPQISFVKDVKGWGWTVEGSLCLDDMEKVISSQKSAIKKKILIHLAEIISILFLVILIASLIAAYTAGKIKKSIKAFSDFFEKVSSQSIKISPDNVNFSEFKELAASANMMIEKRNQVEGKLKLYREIFMNAQDAIALIDLKGNYMECNRANEMIFGYAEAELKGKTPALFMGENNFKKAMKELFEKGKFNTEIVCVNRKGKLLHVLLSVFTVRDEYGNPICYAEMKKDITDKKESESRIKELKQQIEFILGTTKTGLDIIDSNYNVVYIDSEWEKIYGPYEGKKCYEYFMDRSEHCPGCGIPKAFETGKPVVSNETLAKEGNRPIQVTTFPFQNEKGEWMAAEINVDITEQMKIQNELRDYITFQSIVSAFRGPSYEISEPELIRLFLESIVENYDFRMAWYGTCSNNQIRPECHAGHADKYLDGLTLDISRNDSPAVKCAMSKALISRAPFGYQDLERDEDFKTWRDYAMELGYSSNLAIPLIINNKVEGGIMCYSGARNAFTPEKTACLNKLVQEFAITLSDRRKYAEAQQTIRRARDAADSANKAKNEFLFTFGREIRSAMGNIISMSENLLKYDTGAEQRKFIDSIKTSSELLVNLMNDIQDFSRIETGKIEISARPFAIRGLIEETVKMLSFMLQGKNLSVKSVFREAVPLYVSADPDRLRQVLLNLLDNAVKFTKKGGITVSVGALRKIDGKCFLSFSVEDTGIGISPERQKNIFGASSADGGPVSSYGTMPGIGLLVSRKIVEAFGGSISVSSAPGKGSAFRFEIAAEFLNELPPSA